MSHGVRREQPDLRLPGLLVLGIPLAGYFEVTSVVVSGFLLRPPVLVLFPVVLASATAPSVALSSAFLLTILLSLTVFLNMVSATMPVTSDNPLLGNWAALFAY